MSNIPNASRRLDSVVNSLASINVDTTSINTKIPSGLTVDGAALRVAIENWVFCRNIYRNFALGVTSGQLFTGSGYVLKLMYANTSSSDFAYLKLYQAATATSASTPVLTLPIPPNSGNVFEVNYNSVSGGACLRATLNIADNDNNAPTSNVIVNVTYITS